MKNNYFITKALACSFALLFLFSCSEENIDIEPMNDTTLSKEESIALLENEFVDLPTIEKTKGLMDASFYQNLIANAVEPSECNEEGIPIDTWLFSTIEDWTLAEGFLMFFAGGADLATEYVILVEDLNSEQYYGRNGQYTDVLNTSFENMKDFWDIYNDDIRMVGMHSIADDVDKVYDLLVAQGDDPSEATMESAQSIVDLFTTESFDFGQHPLFTFNAFAFSSSDFEYDYIGMGDGILEGFEAIGLGDIAPQAILAHEYAHHIQYENDYFGRFDDQAEDTRYTELMADAYAAYYLTHNQGQGIEAKRVNEFSDVFFNIGDCSFSDPGHHGTYLQRVKAAKFGMKLSKANQRRGIILTSTQFYDTFNRAFNTLL